MGYEQRKKKLSLTGSGLSRRMHITLMYIDDGPVLPSRSKGVFKTKFFVPAAIDTGASRSRMLNEILPAVPKRGFPLIFSGPI